MKPPMDVSPGELHEARRQLDSMRRKLEAALCTLRERAAAGRRLQPLITLAE